MIRRAGADDLDAVIAVFRASRDKAARDGLIPPIVGTGDGLRDFLARTLDDCEVWIDGHATAMLVLTPGWIEHLYVHPDHAGQGLGSELVTLAQTRQPELQLWTFLANTVARAFYAHRGFVEVEFTDGSTNMERQPDVRLLWPRPAGPTDGILPEPDAVP